MFKLDENYEVNRNISRCHYIRYSSSEICTKNTAKSQIYIYINNPWDDTVMSLLNSYFDLNFDVLYAACNHRYANKNDIRLVNSGPITLCNS